MAATILVVDDNERQCDVLKEILQAEGFRVVTARNTEEALNVIEAEHPAVALFDLMLGDGDNGVELFKRVKEKHPDFKAIVYTGYGPEEEVKLIVDAVHEGMIDEFLRKPMASDEVVNAIKKHL